MYINCYVLFFFFFCISFFFCIFIAVIASLIHFFLLQPLQQQASNYKVVISISSAFKYVYFTLACHFCVLCPLVFTAAAEKVCYQCCMNAFYVQIHLHISYLCTYVYEILILYTCNNSYN